MCATGKDTLKESAELFAGFRKAAAASVREEEEVRKSERRENKAVQLGSGRSAKALHTRWLRDQGRIVDRPRVALTTSNANVGEVAAMETLMLLAKLGR